MVVYVMCCPNDASFVQSAKTPKDEVAYKRLTDSEGATCQVSSGGSSRMHSRSVRLILTSHSFHEKAANWVPYLQASAGLNQQVGQGRSAIWQWLLSCVRVFIPLHWSTKPVKVRIRTHSLGIAHLVLHLPPYSAL